MDLRRFLLFFFVFVFVISLAGARAEAQSPTPSGQELADKAKRDHDLGRLNEAIEGYARAYQILGDSGLLFSLAEAHREAGHNADALKIFQTYLRRDPTGPYHESAEKQIKELERGPRSPSAKPTVAPGVAKTPPAVPPPGAKAAPTVPPPGAAAPTPARPAPAPPPTAVAQPAPVPVAPKPTGPPPAPVPVAPKPTGPPPAPVISQPPPLPPPPAPSPPPVLAVAAPITPEPAPGSTVDLTAVAPPPTVPDVHPPLPRWVPWTLAATSVALGAGAIVSGLSASHRYNDLRDSCGQTTNGCPSADVDDVKSRALRTNILWALAGVAALGTGITVYVNVHESGVVGLWRF